MVRKMQVILFSLVSADVSVFSVTLVAAMLVVDGVGLEDAMFLGVVCAETKNVQFEDLSALQKRFKFNKLLEVEIRHPAAASFLSTKDLGNHPHMTSVAGGERVPNHI